MTNHSGETCLKHTPDTDMDKAELAVFWDEIAQHLPKSIERGALGDEKIYRAFATAYPKIKKHLLSSRDTYWKERVRKDIEAYKNYHNPIGDTFNRGRHRACNDLLDNLSR